MDGHSPPNGDAFAQKILRRNPSEQYCFLDVRDVAARSVPGASAEISGMRTDVCRTPSPARLVSSTSSHPRPAPVAKCDSGSSPALAKRVRPDPVSTKGIAQGWPLTQHC